MSKLYIITVATKIDYYLPWLIQSCKQNNNNLIILGLGMKWEGYNWRNKLVLDFINKVNDNDIICVIDGYDIICTRDLNELIPEFLKLYNKYNCKIITGSDSKFTYDLKISHYLLMGLCNNQFLNAGTYIGYAKDLKLIINNIYNLNPKNNADDQELMTLYCKKNIKDFYIDIHSKLFFTFVYPLTELSILLEIKNNNVYYKNERPFFVHANCCGLLNNIIVKLGYTISKTDTDIIYNKLKINIINKCKYYSVILFDTYYSNILLLIIIIFYFMFYYFKLKSKIK